MSNFAATPYPLSAFTGLGGNPINLPVLNAALVAGAFASEAPPTAIARNGGGAIVVWDDFPSTADAALATAIISAHAGASTTGLLQSFVSTAETTNATTGFVNKAAADFVSLPLASGRWGLSAGAQLRTATLVVNSGVRAIIRAALSNDATPGLLLGPSNDRSYTDHSVFSATDPQLWTPRMDVFQVAAGQVLRFMPRFARSGAAVTAAMLEFRADLFRIGD